MTKRSGTHQRFVLLSSFSPSHNCILVSIVVLRHLVVHPTEHTQSSSNAPRRDDQRRLYYNLAEMACFGLLLFMDLTENLQRTLLQ